MHLLFHVKCIILKVIRPKQTKFTKGTFIQDNIISMLESMELTKCSCLDMLFIKIYFEKAYDRVDWSFIFPMLKSLLFGPTSSKFLGIICVF
jgi:hypothetical protein